MKPIVALVGRPNVGKSTLFNRITRTKDALVDNFPGVTRDRLFGDAKWGEHVFTLVDTGGFASGGGDVFARKIRDQVELAVEEADLVVMLMDGKTGISPFESEMLGLLRSRTAPVVYAVNKIDSGEQEDRLVDFFSLGVDRIDPLSAEHGYGINDFMDHLVTLLPVVETAVPDDAIRVAVVGRPNAGKSSLINRILGEERLIVSDVPGTTRDAIDTNFTREGQAYVLVDTAGIRRKGRVSKKLEKFSIIKALRSLERCDVALIVIDAHEGITEQDIRVAGYAHQRGCGAIFLLNKWDLLADKDSNTAKKYHQELKRQSKFLSFAPSMTISALTGQRVPRIFAIIDEVYAQYTTRVGTGQINRIVARALERTEPSLHKGRRLKFYYTTQVGVKPPHFVCFVNYPDAVHFSYQRYLINQIRSATGLDKTPLKLDFRLRTGRIEFGTRRQKKRRRGKKG
jgi:GTP-binding protein